MLTDLKHLQDKLYFPEELAAFNQKYSVHEMIRHLNKSTKAETRQRIKRYFSKLSASLHYKDFLLCCLEEDKEKKKEFIKYVSSQYSEQFFVLIQHKREDVLSLIEHNQTIIPVLLKVVSFQFGIKLIKLFKELYEKDSIQYECLFNPEILRGLEDGLGFQGGRKQPLEGMDSVAQMRYLQIVVNIAVIGGKCFTYVGQLLSRALNLYNTEDILLKMALVQIISGLGEGVETSKLLRQHIIWRFIEKDASDVDQQFYVRKFLLLLLVDMVYQGHYSLSSKMTKDLQAFIRFNITSNGQYLQAAIDLISHLFRSTEGCQLIVQDKQIFSRYVNLRRLTVDSIKLPFYESLLSLTSSRATTHEQLKLSPKYRLVINILNTIGNPENYTSFTSSALQTNYIEHFNKWFASVMQLPFEDAQITLIGVFRNLLNYHQVLQSLFQVPETTKYLLKVIPASDSNITIRQKKTNLISAIIKKGQGEWKGLQIAQYSKNLEKQLKKSKQQSMYALGVE